MKNLYYEIVIVFLFISQLSFSQQIPIDFSNVSDNFNTWGGSTFATTSSPTDSNNTVGQFTRSNSSSVQGHYIDLDSSIDLDAKNTITLMFYAFDSNSHTIIVKLESGTNPDIELALTVSSQNSWSELVYNFATISGNGEYDRLTIIIDNGSSTSGTFLIDDINDDFILTNPNAIDIEYIDLVWADEFDTNGAISSTNWHHQTQLPSGGSWFNGEEQHYTNRIENSFVDNGFLNIVVIKEPFTDQGETKQYTSARLNSKFVFTYGRVDVRAKLPSGDGTWPAIWTLGKNVNEDGGFWDSSFGTTSWPACGEIDIMEHGLGVVNHTSSALHTPSSSGNTVNTASQVISDVANNFHIYSVNWSPNQITFLVDGVGYYTYNPSTKNSSTWPFDLDQYILLNIAMGGVAGTIDSGFLQSSMVIDYIRIYQNTALSTDVVLKNEFVLYPNPVATELNINSKTEINKIEVYSLMGKLLKTENNFMNRLNLSNLKSGIYVICIYSNLGKSIKKIVKK